MNSSIDTRGYNREAMQHAVNVFAEVVSTLNLTPKQRELGNAILRAGINKLNLDANAALLSNKGQADG